MQISTLPSNKLEPLISLRSPWVQLPKGVIGSVGKSRPRRISSEGDLSLVCSHLYKSTLDVTLFLIFL